MFFIPQQNESLDTFVNHPYPYKITDINKRLSPILPLHFEKSYLPENLCEFEYLKLAQCKLFKKSDSGNRCSYETTKFQVCRKGRDIAILEGIKKWETKHIQSLEKSNQRMYLQGLTFKLDRLKDDYAKIPSTTSKIMKLTEIENEIETLKWRINYIKKMT